MQGGKQRDLEAFASKSLTFTWLMEIEQCHAGRAVADSALCECRLFPHQFLQAAIAGAASPCRSGAAR